MHFVLRNTTQNFQSCIDYILWDFDFVFLYIDSLMVTSASECDRHPRVSTT